MTEPLLMIILVAGPLCWLLGGYRWKWVRRFLWPLLAGLVVLLAHIEVGTTLLVTLALIVVNSLPYGERTPWPVKAVVCVALLAPALLLSPWMVVPALLGGTLLWGLLRALARVPWMTHKIFEAMAGLLQAGVLVMGVLAR